MFNFHKYNITFYRDVLVFYQEPYKNTMYRIPKYVFGRKMGSGFWKISLYKTFTHSVLTIPFYTRTHTIEFKNVITKKTIPLSEIKQYEFYTNKKLQKLNGCT